VNLRRRQTNLIASYAVYQSAAGADNIVADNVSPVGGAIRRSCRGEDCGAVTRRSRVDVVPGYDSIAESGGACALLGEAATRS
jgi:hypothetical protein